MPDHALASLLASSVVRSTRLVFISACHSEPAAAAFVDAGVPHVVAVRSGVKVCDLPPSPAFSRLLPLSPAFSRLLPPSPTFYVVAARSGVKVLDDAAALFARHFYFALVEGHTVRQSFDHGTAQLASAAPSPGLPTPTEESSKFILLPIWDPAAGKDDPHDEPLYPWLPPGQVINRSPHLKPPTSNPSPPAPTLTTHPSMLPLVPHGLPSSPHCPCATCQVIERNPLPELEPPYVQKPFIGRATYLHKLVLAISQRRQKEVRPPTPLLTTGRTSRTPQPRALHFGPDPNPDSTPGPNPLYPLQVRLVTLSGPEGVGKSSLAAALARYAPHALKLNTRTQAPHAHKPHTHSS